MISQHIALLATGDEIIQGDILNSNTQEIAQRLFSQGLSIGMHMSIRDNLSEIKLGIRFLLDHHQALIITGGLGPTTDDLTRFALADALHRELIFDEPAWQRIVERFAKLGYGNPPENNRQQALFPEGAIIIPNSKGTAAGCIIKEENDRLIFMLPGPPLECLPILDKVVLPALQFANFRQVKYYEKWLLFGVSEGHIAEQLETLVKPYHCKTGYRVSYPYVEIKLQTNDEKDFQIVCPLIEKTFASHMIENGKQTALELLKKKLLTFDHSLAIVDLATGGSLEAALKTPEVHEKLSFLSTLQEAKSSAITFFITGLEDYWQQKQNPNTHLEIIFSHKNNQTCEKFTIPYRGTRVKLYAVEYLCAKIYRNILSI